MTMRHSELKHDAKNASSDLETLRESFTQLRDDVTKLLHDALGAGKNGAGLIKERASNAVGDLKDSIGDIKDGGVEAVEKFGEKIGERPLLSAAIALGIGFALAKLLSIRR